MKKMLVFSLIVVACSSERDEQFCKCMEVSQEFSNLQKRGLNNLQSIDKATFEKTRKRKDKACEDYQMMSGEEMLKRKATCFD